MRVDPAIVARHLEEAAVEQLAKELLNKGYDVELNVSLGDQKADLVARQGNQMTVFEVKVPGSRGDSSWARGVSDLRDQARAQGGRLELVLVRVPRETSVTIDGIERALLGCLVEDVPPDLTDLAPLVSIGDVNSVEISSIILHNEFAEIAGEAVVTATLRSGEDDEVATEKFPFSFHARLTRSNSIEELSDVKIDVSSWTGESSSDD